jgi:hypothetical protein
MYTVQLPEDLPDAALDKIVDELSKNENLEYAQPVAQKRPLAN